MVTILTFIFLYFSQHAGMVLTFLQLLTLVILLTELISRSVGLFLKKYSQVSHTVFMLGWGRQSGCRNLKVILNFRKVSDVSSLLFNCKIETYLTCTVPSAQLFPLFHAFFSIHFNAGLLSSLTMRIIILSASMESRYCLFLQVLLIIYFTQFFLKH